MRLLVISHKVCWASKDEPERHFTDGGFPAQMAAISELFSETRVAVPCLVSNAFSELTALDGKNLDVIPLSLPGGSGIGRKFRMFGWLFKNSGRLWREVRRADAVHTPIPGDVGTIGLIFALLQGKPLFVRHCGNWLVQRTLMERVWKRGMERFAGGKNVMMSTGGSDEKPSRRNPHIQWIFSSSLRKAQTEQYGARTLPEDGTIKMLIACRLEELKGVDVVIDALALIPNASLTIVGGGSMLESLKKQAASVGVSHRVTFHGKVRQSKVLDLLQEAHVFCYPTSASEGFPKVVLEALATGLPVITTKVSVLPILVGNGGGIILDDATPAALASAVEIIRSDKIAYMRMSRNAVETARQYTLENWRDSIGHSLRQAWGVDSLS